MHPAGSVIVFTVASGLGFGLLTWLGLGLPDVRGWAAFWYYALGFGLAGGGLLASTFHLGNPQRFLKAFSQWRSSWLSREGCLAVAALAVLGLFAIGKSFMAAIWQALGLSRGCACGAYGFCYLDDLCAAQNCAALEPLEHACFVHVTIFGWRRIAGDAGVACHDPSGARWVCCSWWPGCRGMAALRAVALILAPPPVLGCAVSCELSSHHILATTTF